MIRHAILFAAVFIMPLGAQRTLPRLTTDERIRATEAQLQKDPKSTTVRNEMVAALEIIAGNESKTSRGPCA